MRWLVTFEADPVAFSQGGDEPEGRGLVDFVAAAARDAGLAPGEPEDRVISWLLESATRDAVITCDLWIDRPR